MTKSSIHQVSEVSLDEADLKIHNKMNKKQI